MCLVSLLSLESDADSKAVLSGCDKTSSED